MYITPQDILDSTTGGLDIILSYYPDAAGSVEQPNKKFKARAQEKTPSAALKRLQDGTYLVTDFGGDQKPRNAIEIVRLEENLDFKSAIAYIGSHYSIQGAAPVPYTARFEERQKKDDETDGPSWEFKESFSENDIKEIFSRNVISFYKEAYKELYQEKLQEVCRKYGLFSLSSYTWVKGLKAYTTFSDDQYPVYLIDYGTYKKIYQPKQTDKSKRFFYAGEKDKSHMGGYVQCLKAYNELMNSDELQDSEQDPAKNKKIEQIIICSGERDSINVAALGYQVIWLNSETAKINKDEFLKIARLCKEVHVLPDIDDTGRKAAHELGMQFLDIKHIQLPDYLQDQHDWRGRPCKDIRDYLNHFSVKSFHDLVKTAIPYQCWNTVPEYDKGGNLKGYRYVVNNVQLYNFLYKNGFARIEKENEKSGYALVKVNGNTTGEITDFQVRDFLHRFLKDRHLDNELRNAFYRSNQLSEGSLANLPVRNIEFSDFDKTSQWMFFRNKTWKITKSGIDEYRPGEVNRFAWENELLPWNVKQLDPLFTITKQDGDYSITNLNRECQMLRFLENTSKVHWRKQKENVELTDQEQLDHQMHLINKIYVMGYLLHRYKDSSKAWAVFAMDNKISDVAESHGGSGKSIFMKSFRYFMQSITLNGRDRDLTANKHLFENVSKHTDYALIDECSPQFDFNYFYSYITGEWLINGKFQKQFEVKFCDAPKIGVSSNYTLSNPDPSTLRRLIYVVFSDYYHHGPSDEYDSAWSPRDEFGGNLFDDFNQEQWNLTANLYAQAVQFYLSCDEKLNPPMSSIELRELKTIMGENFKGWADVYFSAESDKLDQLIDRQGIMDDFIKSTGQHKTTPNSFKKKITAWCRYNGFELNPADQCDQQGRIIKKEEGQTKEKFYIKTTDKNLITDDRPF